MKPHRIPIFARSNYKGFFLVFVISILLFPSATEAQCAMCRAVLESEASGTTAEGINNGIVYLMAIPYILVAGVFYFVYRKMRS
ncbi:hypothetical protein [Maribacter algicola]|uniref:hypothetical protein n=1 Tax=Maribacter algicola TaxID=2498892 RepID=UPI001FB38447|nr:hypothetical protein [Maribacter algicola]